MKVKKRVLCFGNPYLDMDNRVFEILNELKIPNFEFIKCESFTDILNYKDEKEIIIIDTVKNIKKPIKKRKHPNPAPPASAL